jgi:hypothetical protein
LSRLSNLDPKIEIVRNEKTLSGERIHIDIKKLEEARPLTRGRTSHRRQSHRAKCAAPPQARCWRDYSYALQASGIPANAGSWVALDPATGKFLWQTAKPGEKCSQSCMGLGPASVASGVVFAGSMDLNCKSLNLSCQSLSRDIATCHSSHGGECGERIVSVKYAEHRLRRREHSSRP